MYVLGTKVLYRQHTGIVCNNVYVYTAYSSATTNVRKMTVSTSILESRIFPRLEIRSVQYFKYTVYLRIVLYPTVVGSQYQIYA